MFDAGAVTLVHSLGKGIPRLINVICDQALLIGFAEEKSVIDEEIIKTCISEIQIPSEDIDLPHSRESESVPRQNLSSRSGLFVCLVAFAIALVGVILYLKLKTP